VITIQLAEDDAQTNVYIKKATQQAVVYHHYAEPHE
jgi:hypothetical protein